MSFKCPIEPRPLWCCEQCKELNPDDPQKIRLYCFEESLTSFLNDFTILSLSECAELVKEICSAYSVPMPLVKDGRGLHTARGGYDKEMRLSIKLPRQYRYRLSVIHETAHCIMQYNTRDYDGNHELHGPVYARYLLNLYNQYLKLPLSHLEYVAEKFSLDF
jgi:hypothetical protein